jgi:hypothetical protein
MVRPARSRGSEDSVLRSIQRFRWVSGLSSWIGMHCQAFSPDDCLLRPSEMTVSQSTSRHRSWIGSGASHCYRTRATRSHSVRTYEYSQPAGKTAAHSRGRNHGLVGWGWAWPRLRRPLAIGPHSFPRKKSEQWSTSSCVPHQPCMSHACRTQLIDALRSRLPGSLVRDLSSHPVTFSSGSKTAYSSIILCHCLLLLPPFSSLRGALHRQTGSRFIWLPVSLPPLFPPAVRREQHCRPVALTRPRHNIRGHRLITLRSKLTIHIRALPTCLPAAPPLL